MIQHMSTELDQLATALAKAQSQIQPAIKDRQNPAFRSNYADLASVWDACRVALATNGLSVSQHPGRLEDGTVTVTTALMHASGQHIISVAAAMPKDGSAQAAGSVVTYLRRYALAAAVGVAPGDDDDGHAAGTPAPMPRPQSERQPVPTPRPQPAQSSSTPRGVDPSCPTCAGGMWDNRPKKASGEMNPKAPDFKCRDKGCQGVIWKHSEKAAGPVPSTREPLIDNAPAEDDRGFPF